jgi:uncharacterized protein YdhG (YjbR/CyaY superfamily)
MKYENILSVNDYLSNVAEDKKEPFLRLREVIKSNIPEGFDERISYGMVGYVVPHSIFPAGYHCDPKLPLPFVTIAAQKNFIALYHMGIYANPALYDWFVNEYPKHCKSKLDMGKSCIRFKKPTEIPYDLISELIKKMSVNDWINCYETLLKR